MQVLPGGVTAAGRFRSALGAPFYIARGQGSKLLEAAAEGRLVLPGGVPGGQFCKSCIFERSDSVAFTYHIR